MRLLDAIALLPDEGLRSLAERVVPDIRQLSSGEYAHRLEAELKQPGHVESVVMARQPPIAAVLLALLDADDHTLELAASRASVMQLTEKWCKEVSEGALAHRIPERTFVYRRLLKAAWGNDSILDASEVRLLDLLREELGLFRMEHYLLAHHASIVPYWRQPHSFEDVVHRLVQEGIVYKLEGDRVVLPVELVPAVRRALGVEMTREAAGRLLSRLESGTHLKAALTDNDLPTTGSKSERIERLIDAFVPVPRIVDTMHINDARDLLRKTGQQVSGSKQELVDRIVATFSSGADLLADLPPSSAEEETEPKQLGSQAFTLLFGLFKARQLQNVLIKLDLPHSGSKDDQIQRLFGSRFSETSILSKFGSKVIAELLDKIGCRTSGSKSARIDRLIEFAATRATDTEQTNETPELVGRISKLLSEVDLSSTSTNRFHELRVFLCERIVLEYELVGVKYLGSPKNHRNRVGEALRARPSLLVLISPLNDRNAALEAVVERLDLSRNTVVLLLSLSDDADVPTRADVIAAHDDGALLDRVLEQLPGASFRDVDLPTEGPDVDMGAVAEALRTDLLDRWSHSAAGPMERRVEQAIRNAFGDRDLDIRTKHVSDSRNIGNRISEAVGAGCAALILVVPSTLVENATSICQGILAGVRNPRLALVVGEEPTGGYSRPVVVARHVDARARLP